MLESIYLTRFAQSTGLKIAIIGTRQPTPKQRGHAYEYALKASRMGHTIKTGGAYGIDAAAMDGCLKGLLEVYLPWPGFHREAIPRHAKTFTYDPDFHTYWKESVNLYHPNPQALTQAAFSLMARNYGIVAGSDLVLAFPKAPNKLGGTGQGIRIANALGIEFVVEF
jgi:DNA recombination-mediator protein A